MPGTHECQLSEVDQDAIDIRGPFFRITFAPVFDPLGQLCQHLRDHDAQHDLA
ncbi:hypothetical protein D3C84_1175800 [compost metagenome]